MLGWLALKSATTLSSTAFCSGASPPPRQQYQRISTGPPGGTVAGPVEGGVTEAGAEAPPPLLAGVGVTLDPPHAVTTMANAANRAPGRERRDAMCCSSSDPMGSSAGGCGRDGWAFDVGVGLPALADHDAFDVIASPVAANVAPGELHGIAFGAVGDAFDEQRRRPRSLGEQPSLAGVQQHGLQRLA